MLIASFDCVVVSMWFRRQLYSCHGLNAGQTAECIIMTATFGNSANGHMWIVPQFLKLFHEEFSKYHMLFFFLRPRFRWSQGECILPAN